LNFTNVKLLNQKHSPSPVVPMNLARALAYVAPIAIVVLLLAIA
jgi:hypothetical protein